MIPSPGKGSSQRQRSFVVGLLLIAACSLRALSADTITGLARNLTHNQAAAGDEVILIRLADTMREEGRTRTDARGSFIFRVQIPNAHHLVRVLRARIGQEFDIATASGGPGKP